MGTRTFKLPSSALGGGTRDRTADLLHAMQALSQLSYTPTFERQPNYLDMRHLPPIRKKTGLIRFSSMLAEWTGLEPATPGVTGRYSNQLNYHSNTHMVRSKFQISLQALLKLGVP